MTETGTTWDTVVVGSGLAGLAAAARLAKNRHTVLVLEAADQLGGRLAPYEVDGVAVDDWPGMLAFPAPWRDLFRKSGRQLEDELARSGQALVAAPATRHVFDDPAGATSELVLPSERGVQFSVLSQRYGEKVAVRWRDLLDHLDEVSQTLRPLGGEGELTSGDQLRRAKRVLQPGRSVADLASAIGHPHLAAMITTTAWRAGSVPRHTPGWVAVSLADERRFGRWMVVSTGLDGGERPERSSVLLDRLVERLGTRRVTVRTSVSVTGVSTTRSGPLLISTDDTDDAEISARTVILAVEPGVAYRLLGRTAKSERKAAARTSPALAPLVEHEVVGVSTPLDQPGDSYRGVHGGSSPLLDTEATETIHHTAKGPIITWTRPLPDGRTVVSRHDWTRARPDAGAGIAWAGPRTALRRPPIRSEVPGVHLAGPFSRGGADLSHVVLSGALASYACHDLLTGTA